MKKFFVCLVFLVTVLHGTTDVRALEDTFTMVFDGKGGWDDCLYDYNIDVDSEPGCVSLIKTELIADETGNITDATREIVAGSVRAKKELLIENPAADGATLLIYTNSRPKGTYVLEINGKPTKVTFDEKRMLTGGWCRADIDPKRLRKGLNTFVIYASGGDSIPLYIENTKYPDRSARSLDGGGTWDYAHLGEQGFCDGEYLIRLRLSHHPPRGEIISDYIDTGDLITSDPVKPVFRLRDVRVKADASSPQGTGIEMYLRGGSTPSYAPDTWDCWRPAGEYGNMGAAEHDWRYLQWKAVLTTKKPLRSPVLRRVTVVVRADLEEESGRKPVADTSKNRKIIRGYYNYAYQPYEDVRLQHLREYFRLDEVVGGCSSEFEKFEVLATWLRGQWRDGWRPVRVKGLKTPWDAWIALNLNSDFKASGMCTIYANTFVQCALAVGLNARGVVLDHHFVTEIWSNEYEKWILFDIGFNNHSLRTVHMEMDGKPLSAVEILQAVNAGKLSEIELKTPPLWRKPWRGDQAREAKLTDPRNWRARVGIPRRNNYLQTWLPGELQHGFMQYSYDGYLWWKKTLIPEYEEYTYHTSHYRDMYWTINQVEVFLSRTGSAGELKVQLDTVTPNLDRLLLRIDGGEWRDTPPEFVWKLKEGDNRLEVKPVNKWGLEGITSEITVRY